MTITIDIRPEVQAELVRQPPLMAALLKPMLLVCSRKPSTLRRIRLSPNAKGPRAERALLNFLRNRRCAVSILTSAATNLPGVRWIYRERVSAGHECPF